MLSLSTTRATTTSVFSQQRSTLYFLERAAGACRALSTHDGNHYDVLIVGGGVVGAALANNVARNCGGGGLSVGLVERGPSPLQKNTAKTTTTTPHPRAYALSPRSLGVLGTDVLQRLEGQLGYYDSMQLWEQDSPSTLVFSAKRDLNSSYNADTEDRVLGAVVEDEPLVRSLWTELEQRENYNNVKAFANSAIESIELPNKDNTFVKLRLNTKTTNGKLEEAQEEELSANLLVAADGASSMIRQVCGIPWLGWDYGKTAVTFTVRLSPNNSGRRAYQRFLPHGPVAMLPTFSEQHGTIVWSTTPQHARQIVEMNSNELVNVLNQTLQVGPQRLPPLGCRDANQHDSVLGNIWNGAEKLVDTLHYGLTMSHWAEHDEPFVVPPTVVNVEGPRFAFDLSCRQAQSYTSERVAMVGDAAHTVHPMAGQGLNIGLQDVAVLTETIRQAHDSGMDVGMDMFLQSYHQNRTLSNTAILAGIHTLHEMFGVLSNGKDVSTRSFPNVLVHHGKSLGMNLVNHFGPIRRQLVAIATGGTA